MSVTYDKKIAEEVTIGFERDRVDITDNVGTCIQIELVHFEQMIEHYNTYKKMKEMDGE